jgi:colanic acid biosynthesis glycosyl transferase WcaI
MCFAHGYNWLKAMAKPTLWIFCEWYHPNLWGTGWYITGLAEGLSIEYDVKVVCARASMDTGDLPPAREVRNGVEIHRCPCFQFDNNSVALRTLSAVGSALSIGWFALTNMGKGSIALAVTNPPALPYVIAAICKWIGTGFVLYIQDLYPEILAKAGLMNPKGNPYRLLESMSRWLYRKSDEIVVDGRDVRRAVEQISGRGDVRFIPYWADIDLVKPGSRRDNRILDNLGLADKFVVQYSGNMGRMHDLDTILRAAELLRDHPRIHFLFRGKGFRRVWLEEYLAAHAIVHATISDPVPWSELGDALSACDIGIISLHKNSGGTAVPSRMYNMLAAGKPIVAVTDDDSELALLVRENSVGWIVEPGDHEQLARMLVAADSSPELVRSIAQRAVLTAARYTRQQHVAAFSSCLRSVLNEPNR